MPKVYNKYHGDVPRDAVFIGRGSKWGNPYSHLRSAYLTVILVHTREEAVRRYNFYILFGDGRHLLKDIHELRGKDLVCFCAPKPCHGDVLLELANRR